MALNLSALQQIKPVSVPDPREGLMTLAAARSQMLGDQLKGLQVQQAQGELQSNQLAAEQAQKVREIVAKHGGNIEAALPEINQINPTAGASMMKTFQDIKNLQSEQTVREGNLNETTRHNLADESNARAKMAFDQLQATLNLKKDTKEIDGRIKGFNPETGAYDLDQGAATPKTPPAVRTVTTEQGVYVLNQDGTLGNRLGDRPKPASIETGSTYATLDPASKAKVDAVAAKVKSGEYTPQVGLSALGGVRGGLGGALTEALSDSLILPTAIRTANTDIERAKNILVPIRRLVGEINSTSDVKEKAKKSIQLEGYAQAIGTQFARARGERGVVTDQDVNRVLGLVPGWKSANFSPGYAEENLKLIEEAFNRDQSALLGKYFTTFDKGGGAGGGGTSGGTTDAIRKRLGLPPKGPQ